MKAAAVSLGAVFLLAVEAAIVSAAGNDPPAADCVPGVVVDRSPASSGAYVGSPSIAVLPNGDYVASHDFFGPGTKGDTTAVFRSSDRGRTWEKLAVVQGAFWSSLFTHSGALYLLGTHPGAICIRRSDDGGRTWTEPKDADSGLLTPDEHYHCAPTPVLLHAGRLWRGFERYDASKAKGAGLDAGVISAPADADLLRAASWTVSRFVPGERTWLDGQFPSWREGNAVVDRDGRLLDIIRVDARGFPERAAILHVSDDGREATFDPQADFVEFPGGAKKFTIRYDKQSDLYWSLANLVPPEFQARSVAGSLRNTLALVASADLRQWDVRRIVLAHFDSATHGFQYVDWQFDGDDLIAACRTAYDDGAGGAHSFHDANYLTFHRIVGFRQTAGAVQAAPPDELTLLGRGWSLARLADGQEAFGNRKYVWEGVPETFRNWRITRTDGGVRAELRVRSTRDATLYALANSAHLKAGLPGWKSVPNSNCHYSDKGHTSMTVCWRIARAGEEVVLPQDNWAGTLLLLPPEARATVQPDEPLAAQALQRLKYNHPGLAVDLGVGLWAFPLPMDYSGDGRLDMVVDCPDKPYNGVYVFDNPGVDTAKNPLPVFRPGRRISKGLQMAQLSLVDGRPRVLAPATEFTDFLRTGLDSGVKLPLPANVHPNKVRGNFWRYVDFDGDGRLDIVVGADDWTDYGWDNAYDADGRWTHGPLRGFVYVLRNTGSNDKPAYDKPLRLTAGEQPLETFGWPSPNFADFRGTGKLDLICGEFRDSFTFFENVGTRTEPRYAPGRGLTLPPESAGTGGKPRPLTMDLEMITPVAIDWNGDGHVDLVCGDEDGRVAYIENTGQRTADGTPQFLPPRYFQQEADDVKCGALATPVGVDWDGDGATDIISGNSAGYLLFFKNLSGPGVEQPQWAAPQYLEADGRVIRFMAGANGSIQGPAEAKWGYTTLSVADWDGDGLPDLVVNSIWGKVVWFKNVGTRQSPKLAAAQPIEVEWDGPQPALAYGWLRPEGKALLTQWRTTPVAVDWNQDGLVDLVMLDQEGYLAFFQRARREGRLVLLPPQRVLCDEKGQPLQLSAGIAGRSGRRKLCIVDWDGDGRLDILLNAANARFLRQVDSRDGKWLFQDMGLLVQQNIEGHDVSPTVVDFNGDGIPDFLGGAEDGHFYYLKNPRAKQ